MKWKEDRYQGHDYWQVENHWNRTMEWFAQYKTPPFPPFMGLLLHMQKLDDMDKSAWERIEEQHCARVQTWRAKPGVFRKKLPPDVRDDPMEGPPSET